jgi:thioredoxin-like negative regulator of GroEL
MAKPTRPQAVRPTGKPTRSSGGRVALADVPATPSSGSTRTASRAPSRSAVAPGGFLSIGSAPAAPAPEAIALFQQAAGFIQRHAYDEAARALRSLLERHPGERAILDRARVYLELCERELQKKPAIPKTVEERITAATAALNDGNEASAERLVKGVLAEHPRHELALYLMAVVHARRGAADAAMAALSQAVSVSPEVRAQAKYDADFEILRGMDSFQALTDPPQPAGAPRKPKRK